MLAEALAVACERVIERAILTYMLGRYCVGGLGALLLLACGSRQNEARGVQMNQFISDEKLAAVRICETTVQQLLSELGRPSGQGRDGDFATFSWTAVAMVADSDQVAMRQQGVYAWVDSTGRVANFVVNPTSIPQTPQACGGLGGVQLPPEVSPPPVKTKPNEA